MISLPPSVHTRHLTHERPLTLWRKENLRSSRSVRHTSGAHACHDRDAISALTLRYDHACVRRALLANWMSYLSLGLTIPVLARVISTIVNPDGSDAVSPRSSVLGGDVEALDKILTFLFCGGLGALSDVVGRKPLMAYSALGFAMTCYLQARADKSLAMLYVADFVDGISSCMNNVCQAYVTDASPPEKRAVHLGVFQGVSVAGAFILGFPLSAVISAKCARDRQCSSTNVRDGLT